MNDANFDVFDGVADDDLRGIGQAIARFAVNASMPREQFARLLKHAEDDVREGVPRVQGTCSERDIAEIHNAAEAEFCWLRVALPLTGGTH